MLFVEFVGRRYPLEILSTARRPLRDATQLLDLQSSSQLLSTLHHVFIVMLLLTNSTPWQGFCLASSV